jgi:hypothetical protein
LIKNFQLFNEKFSNLEKIQHYSVICLFRDSIDLMLLGCNPLCISPFKSQRALRGTFHQNGRNRALGDKGPFLAEAEPKSQSSKSPTRYTCPSPPQFAHVCHLAHHFTHDFLTENLHLDRNFGELWRWWAVRISATFVIC